MTTTAAAADPTGTASASRPLPGRMLGIVFSPRATYADVVARPRWLGVLALVVLVGAAGSYIFFSTEIGRTAALDQQVRTAESFGVKVTDAAYEQLEARSGRAKYFGAIAQAVTMPLMALVIAGLAFAVFNAVLGGDGTFRQVFAVVAHSGVIIMLSQLFGLPLAYARESLSGATNLAVFTPFLDESSFAARLLGAIDLFVLWWIMSLAIGLGVLYRRRTAPIATSLIGVYLVLGILLAVIKTVMSGA